MTEGDIMDAGIILVLGLALLFFGTVGYMTWKEHKRQGIHVAEPPTWTREGRMQIEKPQKRTQQTS